MTGRGMAAFLGVLFVGAATVPAPRQDAWTIVGPGGGGTMRLSRLLLISRAEARSGASD